ncbi:MAG: NfeD family protein [Brevinematia bacterium]
MVISFKFLGNVFSLFAREVYTNTNSVVNVIGGTPGFEYWVWASIGTLFMILEIFLPGFILFWFGVSAIFVSFLSLFLLKTLELQVIAWMVLSLVLVFSYFYYKKNKVHDNLSEDPIFKYVGVKGEVIQPIVGGKMGKVKLDTPINGIYDWNAISKNQDETIEVGERVEVIGVDGIKLIVKKL